MKMVISLAKSVLLANAIELVICVIVKRDAKLQLAISENKDIPTQVPVIPSLRILEGT